MIHRFVLDFALAIAVATPLCATSVDFGFYAISNKSGQSDALAPQLLVAVTNDTPPVVSPPEGVGFIFRNEGPIVSHIGDIYFDDEAGVLDDLLRIQNPTGVSLSEGANPANLPGGGSILPTFTAGFSADADSPSGSGKNGVDVGESVGIFFSLAGSSTYSDVLDALYSGALRLGLHVQGIGTSGESDGFVNTNVVPEPGFYGILSVCLIGLALVRRRLRPSRLLS